MKITTRFRKERILKRGKRKQNNRMRKEHRKKSYNEKEDGKKRNEVAPEFEKNMFIKIHARYNLHNNKRIHSHVLSFNENRKKCHDAKKLLINFFLNGSFSFSLGKHFLSFTYFIPNNSSSI